MNELETCTLAELAINDDAGALVGWTLRDQDVLQFDDAPAFNSAT